MLDLGGPAVGLCAVAKNEGTYLEEWIAYHHLMGFAPIRVYAHDCTDNSHAVLARLAKAGLCEWVPFTSPAEDRPEWIAYADGLERLLDRTDWLTFVDIDEMIVTPKHASIQSFLREREGLDAIGVNRMVFGSSGHKTREPGLVMERFTRCAPREFRGNHMLRTLARSEVIELPRAHGTRLKPGTVHRTVAGEDLDDSGLSREVSHDAIRVQRYFTKSRQEWDQRAEGRRSPIKRRIEAEFEENDRNEQEDATILRWADPVRQLIVEINAGDIDIVYSELDAARRRLRELETETARVQQGLEQHRAQLAAAHAALNAETERSAELEQRLESAALLVARARSSATWRIGERAVRLGRLLTFRRTRGDSALDVATRQLGPGS